MKFLVVDDHPIIRFGVRQLLAQAWQGARVEEAEALEAGLQKFQDLQPDLVVLDLNLPDAPGTEGVARMLRMTQAQAKPAPVLVMSFSPESAYASRLLQMGVAGYLPKDLALGELVNAVRRILDGRRYVTPAMQDRLLDLLQGKASEAPLHSLLSKQEYRVMVLLAAGHSSTEVGEAMHLSVKTVSAYTSRILQKTGWKNKTELTKYCIEHGLTDK